MDTHVEQEVKLQVPRRFDLRTLDAAFNGYTASPVEEHKLSTTYFDTDDLRLTRWGISLRHRKGKGWTLKLPEDDADLGVKRVEHNFPDDGGAKPPAEALELVTAFVRGKPVKPVARLRTLRKTMRLHGKAGEEIAEVADDDVRVMQDGRVADRFREVEVELLEAGSPELLSGLTRWLQGAGAGQLDETPKSVRALGVAAQAPPELETPCPTEDDPAGDVIRHALASAVKQLLCQDPTLRLTMDPEVVHKARVATRRLRSNLRSLKPLLDEDWAQKLRDDVKWLAAELGAVRDADVLVMRLRRDAQKLTEEDGQAAEAVIDRFEVQATAARQHVRSVLRERRYVELLDELVEAVANPKLLPEAREPACKVLPPLVEEPWQKLCKAVDRLEDEPDDDTLHKIRIKAKRCRYAVEAIAPVGGKRAERFEKRLARLQTILGDVHDAVVAECQLRKIKGDPEEVFVAGGLGALQATIANEARAAWRKAWKKATKRKLRFWT